MLHESFEFGGYKGCKNPGRQVTRATKLFIVAPNVCGSPVCNLLYVTLLAPRILRLILDFCTPVIICEW